MSLALSSVRDNLSPAVFKDVENFFFFFSEYGESFSNGHCLPISLGTLWPSSQRNASS